MRRDTAALASQTFDVLVVGGGIYGLTVACDAAERGLSVALIERHDFGSGSSFNHLRTIHGGLRYLQTLDIRRSRESIRERRTLARIAPHAVRPLRFVLPLYRSLLKGRLAMRTGFFLDRLVAIDRNRGVGPSHTLPGGSVISRSDVAERFPGLKRRGLTGAACWFDYVTTEADRLTFSWALAAAAHGANLANYVDAETLLTDGRRVIGARALDRRSGRYVDIAARVTLNAAGAGIESLLTPLGISARIPLLRAINLVTSRDAGEEALGGVSTSGRNFFLVPWRGKALFGTWESRQVVDASASGVPDAEVHTFIAELNRAFPALELKATDISLVHRGLVPAVTAANGSVTLQGHEQIRDHDQEGVQGLLTLAGTKYTTARAVAERVTNLLFTKLERPVVPCKTSVTPLPGGDLADVTAEIAGARREFDTLLPSDTLPHLVGAYGSRFRDLVGITRDRREWRSRLSEASPVIGAEIAWAARHEMAETLADAVIRRSPLGALGYPGDEAVARAAAIMAGELGWSVDRIAQEQKDVADFYSRP